MSVDTLDRRFPTEVAESDHYGSHGTACMRMCCEGERHAYRDRGKWPQWRDESCLERRSRGIGYES